MITKNTLPELFFICGLLEMLTVKNSAPGVYRVWSDPHSGPSVEHSEESLRELISRLQSEGWEIQVPEQNY
jgi:hypothetical protein